MPLSDRESEGDQREPSICERGAKRPVSERGEGFQRLPLAAVEITASERGEGFRQSRAVIHPLTPTDIIRTELRT
jgi:hypothetical protein